MNRICDDEMKEPDSHEPEVKQRTADIQVAEEFTFSKFMLSDKLLKTLSKLNFVKPSPIQLKVIPLAKCGLDMIMQAKSGTGKTLAFAICLLETYDTDLKFPQSLVIVPTREIAVQIAGVLNDLGRNMKHYKACEFIGGTDMSEDRKKIQSTKTIVGTPGRILHLINNEFFNTSNLKALVLDEADKLLENGQMARDVTTILKKVHKKIQILATTATVTSHLEKIMKKVMKNPIGVTPKHEIPVLLGIKQFVKVLPRENDNILLMNSKIEELHKIFSIVTFKQCLLFTDSQTKTESYGNYLNKRGWPNEVISGAQDQSQRLAVLEKLIKFKCRILITTDLMARGIDIENINLIINLDLPYDCYTYLHRIGRAGRFGSHGLAVTFVNGEEDVPKFQKMLGDIGGESLKAMKFPEQSTQYDFWDFEQNSENILETIAGVTNKKEESHETETNNNEETAMDNMSLLEITRKLVDDTSKTTKAFDLNAIIEDYEKCSSGSTPIHIDEITEPANADDENIFLKTIEDLNLYEDESDKQESESQNDKKARHVIFKRIVGEEEEVLSDDESLMSYSNVEESEESDVEQSEESNEEDSEESDVYQEEPAQEPSTQGESYTSAANHNQPSDQPSIYQEYVSSGYAQWENIYQFQLAHIQNYINVARK